MVGEVRNSTADNGSRFKVRIASAGGAGMFFWLFTITHPANASVLSGAQNGLQ